MNKAVIEKLKNLLSRIEAIKDSLSKRSGSYKQFKKGVNVLDTMLKIKQRAYADYKKSNDPKKKDQILAIIQNQITFLQYCRKTALPEMAGLVNELLVDLGFNTVPIAKKLLDPLERALQLADGKIDPQIQTLNSQITFARSLEQEAPMFERSIEAEKAQLVSFKDQFSEITDKRFKRSYSDYLDRLKAINPRYLKTAGATAVFTLIPMVTFGAEGDQVAGAGMSAFDFLTSSPLIIPLIIGCFFVALAGISMLFDD